MEMNRVDNKININSQKQSVNIQKNIVTICPEHPTELMQESANLLFRIPVFLSHPSRLNVVQQQFVDAIIRKIRKELLFPRTDWKSIFQSWTCHVRILYSGATGV